MPSKKFFDRIRALPFGQKLIFWGGLSVTISVFLPWYQEVDRFTAGVIFYGITGPLYLVGVLFLATGIASMLSLFHSSVKEKIQDFGFKLPAFHIISGGFLLFLLVLATTVYFHPKFGVSITAKDMRFGMLLGFIGTVLLLIGGVLEKRTRSNSITEEDLFSEGKIEPLVELPDRHQQPIHDTSRQQPQPSETPTHPERVEDRPVTTIEDALDHQKGVEQSHLDL